MKLSSKMLWLAFIMALPFSAPAQSTTDGGESYESFFVSRQKFDTDGTELYSTNYELKKHKKVGLGVAIGGSYGAYGVNAELNLDPSMALIIGVGSGPSYGTFSLLGKYSYEAHYLSPYFKAGYSKWFSSGNVPSNAASSDVLRQIYSTRDLRAGKFDGDFAVASIGAEYNQLEGELSGFNFYGEFILLTEMKAAKVIPSGAVGMTYFY